VASPVLIQTTQVPSFVPPARALNNRSLFFQHLRECVPTGPVSRGPAVNIDNGSCKVAPGQSSTSLTTVVSSVERIFVWFYFSSLRSDSLLRRSPMVSQNDSPYTRSVLSTPEFDKS